MNKTLIKKVTRSQEKKKLIILPGTTEVADSAEQQSDMCKLLPFVKKIINLPIYHNLLRNRAKGELREFFSRVSKCSSPALLNPPQEFGGSFLKVSKCLPPALLNLPQWPRKQQRAI